MMLHLAGMLMMCVGMLGCVTLWLRGGRITFLTDIGIGLVSIGAVVSADAIFSDQQCDITTFLWRCAFWGFGMVFLLLGLMKHQYNRHYLL